MTVTRINEFHALAGHGDTVRERLQAVLPTISAAPGCRSCQLLQAQDDPTRIMVVEVWDTVDAHMAALTALSPDTFAEIMRLLVTPSTGRYYR
jgi:quinol monooxygenase YgiN